MQKFNSILYDKQGNIVVITIDEQEKMNALTVEAMEGLMQAYDALDMDEEINAGVITGAGKHFSAGADISCIGEDPVYVKQRSKRVLKGLYGRTEKLLKPLVAAVNGLCLGGGLEIAMGCDFIIASERAQFGVPEVNVGVLPFFAIVRLHLIVGRSKAKEMMMLGDPISAEEAFRCGLVSKVVPPDKLMEEAVAFAKRIADKPRLAVQMAKSAVNRHLGGEDIAYAEDAFPFLIATADAREGLSAFLEKRTPHFTGR